MENDFETVKEELRQNEKEEEEKSSKELKNLDQNKVSIFLFCKFSKNFHLSLCFRLKKLRRCQILSKMMIQFQTETRRIITL